METIAKRLLALRTAKRISQRKLAELCDVSQPTIANIEGGRTTQIKGYVLESLARALNTSTTYILDGVVGENSHEASMLKVELAELFSKLSEDDQQNLIRTARALYQSSSTRPSVHNPFHKSSKKATEAR